MIKCTHDLIERDVAVTADGMCPLCLQAQIAALESAYKGKDDEVLFMESECKRLETELLIVNERVWKLFDQIATRAEHEDQAPFDGCKCRVCALESALAALQRERDEWLTTISLKDEKWNELLAERDALRARLEDYDNAMQGALNPHPDEVHCSCVLLLRAQLDNVLREEGTLQMNLGAVRARLAKCEAELQTAMDLVQEAFAPSYDWSARARITVDQWIQRRRQAALDAQK